MTPPLRNAVAIRTVVEFMRTISEADVYLVALRDRLLKVFPEEKTP